MPKDAKFIKDQMNESEANFVQILDDKSCITIIQEYLIFKKLKKTSLQLRDECMELELAYPNIDAGMETSIVPEDAEIIITSLNNEDFTSFFKMWEEKVPAAARVADPEARRLFFLLNVAVATKTADGMEKLREFFTNNSQQPLTREADILHYYALPYVAYPRKHPAFQHLYKDTWWAELRSNVALFIQKYTVGTQGPRLPLITLQNGPNGHHQLYTVKRKCKQLQNDYHRLLGVAGELTLALESAVRGESLNLAHTLSKCTLIYPELFPSSNPSIRGTPESVLRRSLQLKNAMQAELELDHRKLRTHLSAPGNSKSRLLLMQALRWRISRSDPEERDLAVAGLVRHDVLGLRGGFSLVTLLTAPGGDTPHPLQQSVARLMNALASLRAGRDYLSTAPVDQVVGPAAACLTGAKPEVKVDDVTADMLLALLQKLSLRRVHRETMISGGVVEWLVPRLERLLEEVKVTPEAPTYALEYAAALLMNLCLHTRAKQRCIPLSGRALQLLSGMLGSAPSQALPYVNGALYSLLCEPLINQQARHMGLEKLLQFYLKQSDGELRRQLEHILALLRGPRGPPEGLVETHSEDEGEADIASSAETVEEEVDALDPVKGSGAELTGEQLLRSQFKALFPSRGPANSLQTPSTQSLDPQLQPRLSTPLPTTALEAANPDGVPAAISKETTAAEKSNKIDESSENVKDLSEITSLESEILTVELQQSDGTVTFAASNQPMSVSQRDLLKINEESTAMEQQDENVAVPTTSNSDVNSVATSENTVKNEDEEPTEVFSPKPKLARTPPPRSATSRLQELSKSVADIQSAITKLS